MKDETLIKIVGMVLITFLTLGAIYREYDSALIGSTCALIGGIVGYEVGKRKTEG